MGESRQRAKEPQNAVALLDQRGRFSDFSMTLSARGCSPSRRHRLALVRRTRPSRAEPWPGVILILIEQHPGEV